ARLADLRALDDADDLAVLADIWMSAVTAMVNWWLNHPDSTAEDMTRRSERILTAIANGAEVS
ncbi:TetR/AcrR family transcriptional regulator, partial [Mycobacteriaceae bacterium Msp059]|nr:TetR/AcrR family transcriptional regulator [Mycobacteriaceae bacterium Msp059]